MPIDHSPSADHSPSTSALWPVHSAAGQPPVATNPAGQFVAATQALDVSSQATDSGANSLASLADPAAANLGDLRQHLADLVKGVVRTNLEASQAILKATTRGELLALQQRFMRDYLTTLMQGSFQLIHTVRQAALHTPSRPE